MKIRLCSIAYRAVCFSVVGLLSSCSQPLSQDGSVSSVKSSLSNSVKGELMPKKSLIVWNGEKFSAGSGWSAVTNKDTDAASFEVDRNKEECPTTCLRFQGSGDEWMGVGWNWLNVWEDDVKGQDVSKYRSFSFDFKVTGNKIPNVHAFSVRLAQSANKQSKALVFKNYIDDAFLDSQWHNIVIPVESFNDAKDFVDLKNIREVRFSAFSAEYIDFDLYIDNIVFLKK